MSTVTVHRVDWDDADAVTLRAAQRTELDARYGSDDHEPGTPPSAADVPVFLLARDAQGRPVACGGLRPLNPATLGAGIAEIKRMFADPVARGTGAAIAVLRALEDEARNLGLHRLVLETGTEQPDAVRFYTREGYTEIELYGSYIGSDNSICMSRSL